ncbi:hypothetical protein [Pseudogemmobacter sonorensis]|uniref:hypothetical protein n=1 Tax=Pseudogemmobacter sonorensis TaxID=2989681 RepID=UPI00368DBCCA
MTTTRKIRKDTRRAAEAAGDAVETVTDAVAEKASDVAGEIGARASRTRRAAAARIEEGRDSLAELGERLAADLAERLRGAAGAAQETAAAVPVRLREGANQAVERIRDNHLAEDLRGAVRRNPGLFVAGAALAGFALAQILRGRSDDGR